MLGFWQSSQYELSDIRLSSRISAPNGVKKSGWIASWWHALKISGYLGTLSKTHVRKRLNGKMTVIKCWVFFLTLCKGARATVPPTAIGNRSVSLTVPRGSTLPRVSRRATRSSSGRGRSTRAESASPVTPRLSSPPGPGRPRPSSTGTKCMPTRSGARLESHSSWKTLR